MFELQFSNKAQKFIDDLDNEEFDFLTDKLDKFAENPSRFKIKRLKGTKYCRVRFDDFRVIYTKNGIIIKIDRIDRRKDVYRRLK